MADIPKRSIDGFARSNHSVETWIVYGDAAANTFDASTWTGSGTLMFGFGGNDTLRGGLGNDDLRGGDDNDTLEGNAGNDSLDNDSNQYAGHDTLRGGPDHDILSGGSGNDTLEGGPGNDQLFGGDDNDILRDGPGTNMLNGEAGSDIIDMQGTTVADLLFVDVASFTVNGSVSTMSNHEILTGNTFAGIDEGTQVPGNHPLPYTVNGLEPTAASSMWSCASPTTRATSAKTRSSSCGPRAFRSASAVGPSAP